MLETVDMIFDEYFIVFRDQMSACIRLRHLCWTWMIWRTARCERRQRGVSKQGGVIRQGCVRMASTRSGQREQSVNDVNNVSDKSEVWMLIRRCEGRQKV